MAGGDVHTTEVNHYWGRNSGPGRGITLRWMLVVFVGTFLLSAAGFGLYLSSRDRPPTDVADGRRSTPASAGSTDSSTASTSDTADPTTSTSGTAGPGASAGSAEPAFVARSSFPGSASDPIAVGSHWAFALDHELTASQVAGLEHLDGTDGQAVWNYLRPLGARLVSDNWQTGPRITFKMVFLSDTSLSIQSMQPVQIACTESTATTLVDFAGEGDDAVPTVEFSLLKPDEPLAAVDSSGNTTGPYFGNHQIDLGTGTTPGGLNVEATGDGGQSCSWRFSVGYATASGQSTETVDDAGRPFTIEGAPQSPVQHVQYGLSSSGYPRWAECHTAANCP
jgi:hypothetical protein